MGCFASTPQKFFRGEVWANGLDVTVGATTPTTSATLGYGQKRTGVSKIFLRRNFSGRGH